MADPLWTYVVVCGVALLASGLTFFSGFGLGTLLLPAYALFVPVDAAVALTAVVHFLNGLFKFALVGRHADRGVVLRFGLPAIFAAFVGAWLLIWLGELGVLYEYDLHGRRFEITPVKLVIGLLLAVFAGLELHPRASHISVSPRYLPLGGLLSGFFGGLSGTQGALRSAFLIRAGLSKEAFIATGVVLSILVDASRLTLYSGTVLIDAVKQEPGLLAGSVVAAFTGAVLGNQFLRKMTLRGLQRVVGGLLLVVALGLILGLL